MEQEVCLSAPEALDLTVQRHYSALVIDFDLPGAATVARMARLAPSRRRPVIFGMIGALTEISETFQAGANFIFYKPLGVEQIVRCLRAGRGFMRPDRRTIAAAEPGIAGLSAVRHRRASGHGAGFEPERPGAAGSRTLAAGAAGAAALCFARHQSHGGGHGRGDLGRRWRTRRHAVFPPDAGFAKISETVVCETRRQEESGPQCVLRSAKARGQKARRAAAGLAAESCVFCPIVCA